MTAPTTNVLFVKHLPKRLTVEQRIEFLTHFGAKNVKCMKDTGKMKYTAFAIFEDHEAAACALKQLHQLEFFGQILSVEYSKQQFEKYKPPSLKDPPLKLNNDLETETTKRKKSAPEKTFPGDIHYVASKLGANFPPNPKYEYMYPPPTVNILTNIANALASVPKFYVQVLHLMNKMNLPVPFGPVTATPPIEIGHVIHAPVSANNDQLEHQEMEIDSTEESELESSSEEADANNVPKIPATLKRPLKKKEKPSKRFKLQITTPQTTNNKPELTAKPEDVFENIGSQNPKKNFEFKLSTEIGKVIDNQYQRNSTHDNGNVSSAPADNEQESESIDSGFGIIKPVTKQSDSESESDDSNEQLANFISSSELRKNRLSESERKSLNVFRNYDAGEPSSRLYIKNVNHKRVHENDLKRVFGRYVNWDDETEVNMFDLRLMKEGRMKGQAFITLPSEKIARKAVYETNGFLMEDKPLVVQFARSAKPK
ncbi:RNA-binding region-containing protein 3-like [Tubulanus polymorphus]|uniref:RNA-binding region-containing protein 3-like n=1 Tax=Tubulanus polymorphus TaxID=672921 RepID=UPI003DA533C5